MTPRWAEWLKRPVIYRRRWELHQWLTLIAAEFPGAGLAPCDYGRKRICECHLIAHRKPRPLFADLAPRRPPPG